MSELIELGKTALKGGYLKQASDYYRQALVMPGEQAQGHYGLALVALKQRHFQEALKEFRLAAPGITGDPDFNYNFGTALRMNERLQDAVEQFEAALTLDEEHALSWAGLGFALVQNGDIDTATRYFSRALKYDPDMQDAQLALGGCLHKRGDIQAALYWYRRALHDDPASDEARFLLGQTLQESGRSHEAVCFLAPLAGHPRFGLATRGYLAQAWLSLGGAEKVLAVLEGLQAPEAVAGQLRAFGARALNMLGRNEDALALCRQLIKEWPGNGFAWNYLLDMSRAPLSAAELRQLEQEQQKAPTAQMRIQLAFALAVARERAGDYEGEWRALELGNAEAAKTQFYSAERASMAVEQFFSVGPRERIEQLAAAGDHEYRPIFILAMPRAGTTLVEQILSSHSRIEAAGESGALSFVMEEYVQEAGLGSLPELLEQLTPEVVGKLAAEYRRTLEEMGVTGNGVVEKSINNIKVAGLLYMLFPQARFVAVHRHPLDVTFGCFKRLFTHQSFSFTLQGCAHEYRLSYLEALPHWREVLPVPIHEIHYEDLVADQERVTRELLEYVGVEWQDACLQFHRNQRQVGTASLNQVREGLFTNAAGRWERYGALLDPLREALAAEGVVL